jgi:hypothetical protein
MEALKYTAINISIRHVILENSGSTATMDGKVLTADNKQMRPCSRWEEIKTMGRAVAVYSVAAGIPCEVRVLNPLLGPGFRVESEESLVGLDAYLKSVGDPRGGTPIAEAIRTVRSKLEADKANIG